MLKHVFAHNPNPAVAKHPRFTAMPVGLSRWHPQSLYLRDVLEARGYVNPFASQQHRKCWSVFTNDTGTLFMSYMTGGGRGMLHSAEQHNRVARRGQRCVGVCHRIVATMSPLVGSHMLIAGNPWAFGVLQARLPRSSAPTPDRRRATAATIASPAARAKSGLPTSTTRSTTTTLGSAPKATVTTATEPGRSGRASRSLSRHVQFCNKRCHRATKMSANLPRAHGLPALNLGVGCLFSIACFMTPAVSVSGDDPDRGEERMDQQPLQRAAGAADRHVRHLAC